METTEERDITILKYVEYPQVLIYFLFVFLLKISQFPIQSIPGCFYWLLYPHVKSWESRFTHGVHRGKGLHTLVEESCSGTLELQLPEITKATIWATRGFRICQSLEETWGNGMGIFHGPTNYPVGWPPAWLENWGSVYWKSRFSWSFFAFGGRSAAMDAALAAIWLKISKCFTSTLVEYLCIAGCGVSETSP